MIKMRKTTFVKINKFLPLLTDTLPYETPVLFSNRGFYTNLRAKYNIYYNNLIKDRARGLNNSYPKTIEEFFFDIFFNGQLADIGKKISHLKKGGLIPYGYKILKGPQEYRKISVVHPISQIEICDFYEKYWQEILFYTLKTDVSLRHPAKRVSKVFRRYSNIINKLTKGDVSDQKGDEVSEIKEKIDITSVPTNYFVNKRYKFLYQFYDSVELLSFEQRFGNCIKFDIKRCFDSIYTHSIAWATRGKEYSKRYRSEDERFDSIIDQIMMRSNWGETNGIPIGSEFSRIFAEIILQSIDKTVENKLLGYKPAYKKGKDYIIKRYVDDYFVFFNHDDVYKKIIDTYVHELMEYKLFINSEKNVLLNRPFVTNINSAKQILSVEIKTRLKSYHTPNNEKITKDNLFANINNISFASSGVLIKKLRYVVADKEISVFDVSGFLFGILKKDILKIFNMLTENKELVRLNNDRIINGLKRYLSEILDLSFYMFHVSTKPNNTFGLCKICFAILEMLKLVDSPELSEIIKQQIYSSFLLFFENNITPEDDLVDLLDILWVLSCLGNEYKLSADRLEKYLIPQNKDDFSYFSLVMFLAYIKNDKEYEKIKKRLLQIVCNKFKIENEWVRKTDLFMLFFDIISCPYIDIKCKESILNICDLKNNPEGIVAEIAKSNWFFGWNEDVNIKTFLEIKELNSSY